MDKKTAWEKLSPAAKENKIKYDQKNYSVIGCKLPREIADSFRAYCASQGKSVSSVLSDFVKSTLAANQGEENPPAR